MLKAERGLEIISHVRPINARTVYPIDQVGKLRSLQDRPFVSSALERGEMMDGGVYLAEQDRWIRTLAVPVRDEGQVQAVLVREFSAQMELAPGQLEAVCFSTFRRIASMISAGTFPFRRETTFHDHPPRVGDGVMLFDGAGRLEYASPNAFTVLRQVGIGKINMGKRPAEMGFDSPGIREAYANRLAYSEDISVAQGYLGLYCLPLIAEGSVTGALVLVRDITDLRQRDRLLVTKDAMIAEIHHRVKNSLQTVSSLLQLQSRRTGSADAQLALKDSARRIETIGIVHELLSQRTDHEVRFREILELLASSVTDSLLDPNRPVLIEVHADPSVLPSKITSPLALVISELLQNCIDHARCSRATVSMRTDSDTVLIGVSDDGIGFSSAADLNHVANLGLTIVRTIVETELNGTIAVSNGSQICNRDHPGPTPTALAPNHQPKNHRRADGTRTHSEPRAANDSAPGLGACVEIRVPLFSSNGDDIETGRGGLPSAMRIDAVGDPWSSTRP